jgi:membrane protein
MPLAPRSTRHNGWYYSQQWWRTLKISYLRYLVGGTQFLAAAIAFYCLICLPPLGILLAALLQHVLRNAAIDPEAYRSLAGFVQEQAGGAADEIMRLIDAVLTGPAAPMGGTLVARLLSVGALVWAGLRLFDIVQVSLAFIWPGRIQRGYVVRKLISLVMLIASGLLFVLLASVLSLRGAALQWIRQLPQLELRTPLPHGLVTFAIGLVLSAVAYFLLYKFMPARRVAARAALVGALFAAVLWQLISPIFTRFIVVPLFGNLGWIIIFGLWAFMGAQVMLMGAQLAAAYEHVFVSRRPRGEDDLLIDASRRRVDTYLSDRDAEAERTIEELGLDRPAPACRHDADGQEAINGIILAGGRIPHAFAEAVGTDIKGLIPIAGHAAVEYVVAAMRQVPGMQKLVLVGDKAAFVHHPVAEQLDGIIDEGPDIWHNLMRALRFLRDDRRVLLGVSDTPLVTAEALCAFLRACEAESDLCYPVTARQPTRGLFGRRLWVFLPLREGWVTHTCNILFDPRLALKNRDFVERFLSNRKDLWGAAGTLGLSFAVRFLLSWYLPALRFDMPEIARQIEAITGARRCQGIMLDYPEIALDIDKPSDVAEIEAFLERERAKGQWRSSLDPPADP